MVSVFFNSNSFLSVVRLVIIAVLKIGEYPMFSVRVVIKSLIVGMLVFYVFVCSV